MADRRCERELQLDVPVRILVTGDTHLSKRRNWLPEPLIDGITDADVIIHTGDFSVPESLLLFNEKRCTLGVCGNNDVPDLAQTLPDRLMIRAGNRTIRVTHGHLERGPSARVGVQKAHAGSVDLVIYGHSHKPHWEEVNSTWFLNPGSPTMKRREPRYSFAWLDIDQGGNFNVSFVYFDNQK
jgi:uncharacterized protein